MIPLAVAKAPALKKLRMWVKGDKIVFAIWEVALGYKIRLEYNLPAKPLSGVIMFLFTLYKASALPFNVHLPVKGFILARSTKILSSDNLFINCFFVSPGLTPIPDWNWSTNSSLGGFFKAWLAFSAHI